MFLSEESHVKHNNSSKCPQTGFEHEISSSNEGYIETDMFTSMDQLMESNGNTWNPNQVEFFEPYFEQESDSMQQQNYSGKNVQQIMTCSGPSNYHLQGPDKTTNFNRSNEERNIQTMFSGVPPVVTQKYTHETGAHKTLSEINSISAESVESPSNVDNQFYSLIEHVYPSLGQDISNLCDDMLLSIQDPTVSDTQSTWEQFILSDENEFHPMDFTNMLEMEDDEWPFIPFKTDDQPTFDDLKYIINNDVAAFVVKTPLVQPVSQEPPKRRKSPRKVQPNSVVNATNFNLQVSHKNSYVNDTVLQSRRCKSNSLKKGRGFISKSSKSGASDQEYPPVSAQVSSRRARKVPYRFEPDSGYEDSDTSDTHSFSLRDTLTEDETQKKRQNNNESSRRSRNKRKKLDQEKEVECKQLQERCNFLTDRADKLDKAVKAVLAFVFQNQK